MNLHSGLSSKLISGGGLFILIAHHNGFQIFWFVHRICHLQDPWFHYRHVLTHNHSTVLLVCKSRRTIVPLSQWPSVRVLQIRSKNAWLRWILGDASMVPRWCFDTPSYIIRYMSAICSVYVRYMSGSWPNIYRTSAVLVPNINPKW